MKFNKIITAILFFIASCSFAANRYVNSATGNDGNTGLMGAPWKTTTWLNNHWSLVSDTVFLNCNGVFAPSGLGTSGVLQPDGKSGTPDHYIVISSYGTGAKPIISTTNSTSAYAFRATGLSYFVIENVEFRGNVMLKSTPSGFHHVKFLNSKLDGSYAGGGSLFTSQVVTEVSAEKFTYYDFYDLEIGYCEFVNTTARSINMDTGTRNYWFHHNKIHGGVNNVVGMNISQGIRSVIEYNVIYDCQSGIKIIPQRNRNDSVIIRGNLIYNLTSSSGFGIALQNSRHSQVYNNTVYAQGAYGAALFGWLPSDPVNFCGFGTWGFEDNIIANNIFYGGVILGTCDAVGIRYYGRTDTIRYTHNIDSLKLLNTWTHNLYFPISGTNLVSQDHEGSRCVTWSTGNGTYSYTMTGRTYPTVTTTSNFNTNWNGNAPTITGEKTGNPLFINAAIGDFRILSNSPAHEAGSSIVSYTKDLDGNDIIGKPSIGAYYHYTPPPPPPATPELRSPSNGTLNNTNPPLLSWNASTDAASYRLQVATDSSFSTKVFDDSTLTQTSKQVTSLSNNTKYYWRVNAKNNGGTSVYSPAWNFMTIIGLSSIPTLLQPIDGAINLPTALTLSWNASMYASTYRVQISADSLFITIKLDDSTITGTSKQAGSLLTNTKYYWRVNAKNMVGTSSYSKARTFTTLADTPTVDTLLYYKNGYAAGYNTGKSVDSAKIYLNGYNAGKLSVDSAKIYNNAWNTVLDLIDDTINVPINVLVIKPAKK